MRHYDIEERLGEKHVDWNLSSVMHYWGICVGTFYLWEPQFHPEQKRGKTGVRRAISLTWDRNKTRPSAHLEPLKSLLKRLCCVNYGKLSVLISSGCYNNNDIDWMA